MTCPICGDKGMVRVRYRGGEPDEYGVCRCAEGQHLRIVTGKRNGPGWPAWTWTAVARGIPFEQVFMVEDILDEEDLARIPTAPSPTEPSIASAMQTQKRRR